VPKSKLFEELDYRPTPIGALSLRRRRELSLGIDVFEIKLGDEYLMSSLFTASEIALARLGLSELAGDGFNIVVGGLGLGYTAKAVLEHPSVGSLIVVDMLQAVIDWHRTGLTSTTRPLLSSMTAAAPFIGSRVSARSPRTSSLAAFSVSGRTTRPTGPSPTGYRAFSRKRGPNR
jgi:hypothetical protein